MKNKILKDLLKIVIYKLLTMSLRASNKYRKEEEIRSILIKSASDLSKQYTSFEINSPYIVENLRCIHSFQIALVLKTLKLFGKNSTNKELTIVDIGDSSGTHLKYLKDIVVEKKLDWKLNLLSVNLDPIAIEKIKKSGIEAVECRAENLVEKGIKADIFLSFEMLEHLFDPINFLHDISAKTDCSYFAVTVPYLRQSRVGMIYLRKGDLRETSAENVHIFELSVEDWRLIFKFSGWEIIAEDIYLQYPKFGILRLTKRLWKWLDYEGFYGVILQRNSEASEKYKSWPE
jgi:2-polyprenyl-3-methyl-5-hydroxy-6-metoxy-1,4-benzoquinol methylase